MIRLIFYILCFLVISGQVIAQPGQEVSAAEKQKFLQLLNSLPADHEFFTEEAVNKAAPYIGVLFALTEADIDKHHIYPLLALSRDLCERKESRLYGLNNFQTIRHPLIKLFWGAVLFDAKVATPQIVEYLRAALNSKEQSKTLSEMIGPKYREFKKRVLAYPAEPK